MVGTISIVNNFKTINGMRIKQKRLERVTFEKCFTYTINFEETSLCCDAECCVWRWKLVQFELLLGCSPSALIAQTRTSEEGNRAVVPNLSNIATHFRTSYQEATPILKISYIHLFFL